ncbi:MAG: hypothetical protein ACFFCH_11660, partial [Promethearchaeota archaeon]
LALISIISILLSVIMIALFFIIPGFPLILFLFLPPLFCWGLQGREEEPPSAVHPAKIGPRYCPQCGKHLLEPSEIYCPRCGAALNQDDQ